MILESHSAHGRHLRPSSHSPEKAGSLGVGDEYYPGLGNDGYDASHYDLKLRVEPKSNEIVASSTMSAKALENLDSLNLDFHGLVVDGIHVNGKPATFRREEDELIVVPATALASGSQFEVKVDYHGKPQAKDSIAGDFKTGWKNQGRGIVVDSQPDGGQTWFPNNDHPLDKATYSMHIDVPKGYTVASNGTLQQIEDQGDRRTFHWQTRDPMATYLATVAIGNYVEETQTGPNGLPIHNFFPPEIADKARFDFARTPEMIDLLSKRFGAYPFESYGVIVPNDGRSVDGGMETQTRSLIDRNLVTGDRSNEDVVVHELAHQWFGNLVSVAQWKDLWLHEGFASYCEWMWIEQTKGPEALEKQADRVHARLSRSEGISIGNPPPDDLFHHEVYEKGALALHALRGKLGDEAFFGGVKSYLEQHAGDFAKNPRTIDFQKHMEGVSGQPLGEFFDQWIYQAQVPELHQAA